MVDEHRVCVLRVGTLGLVCNGKHGGLVNTTPEPTAPSGVVWRSQEVGSRGARSMGNAQYRFRES